MNKVIINIKYYRIIKNFKITRLGSIKNKIIVFCITVDFWLFSIST